MSKPRGGAPRLADVSEHDGRLEDEGYAMSQAEIARELGISQQMVQRIEARALAKLRVRLKAIMEASR